MCPGADVALYIHHNPGQESESMVSLAGEPYSALPTAFLYRDQYISACSCGRPLVDYAMLQQQQQDQITVAGVPVQGASPQFLPVPFKRPMPSEDPETIANRRGEFTAEPPQVSIPGAMAVLIGPDGKRVRVVGPSYYYAQ